MLLVRATDPLAASRPPDNSFRRAVMITQDSNEPD
jgi:hypothetical protein